MIQEKNIKELYRRWYSSDTILFSIIKHVQKREVAFLHPKGVPVPKDRGRPFFSRDNRLGNTQSVAYHVRTHRTLGVYPNWYVSLAEYRNGIPFVNKESGQSKKEVMQEWEESGRRASDVVGEDFVVDIDASPEMFFAAKESAILLHEYMNKRNFPHSIRFTGHGFHFYTHHSRFSHLPPDPTRSGRIAALFFDRVSEMIDKSIYDDRRVIKIPHTLAICPDGAFVVAPVNDAEMLGSARRQDFAAERMMREGYLFRHEAERTYCDDGIVDVIVREADDFSGTKRTG